VRQMVVGELVGECAEHPAVVEVVGAESGHRWIDRD
jgi:hypothetical protein